MSTLTLPIYPEDCIGDSSAKHNYNALSLNAAICNLSSQFFSVDNNYFNIFNSLQNDIPIFNNFASTYGNTGDIDSAAATVSLLSSYWSNYEFSIHLPVNISSFSTEDVVCPTVTQDFTTLQSIAFEYLNLNYPAINFPISSVVNVVVFVYSTPVNPSFPSDLITSITSPEFSYMTRHMNASLYRQDVHFANGNLIQFINDGNGNWNFVNTIAGNPLSTKNGLVPNLLPSQTRILVPQKGQLDRATINLTINSNINNYNVYAAALNSGHYIAGVSDITLTISAGVTVGSSDTAHSSLVVNSDLLNNAIGFTEGDTVTIVNNGNIIGAGGKGGVGMTWQYSSILATDANNGTDGGDAILLQFPTFINNLGTIAGGGGGGAGGFIPQSSQLTFELTTLGDYTGGGGGGGGAGSVAGIGNSGGIGYDDIAYINQSAPGGGFSGVANVSWQTATYNKNQAVYDQTVINSLLHIVNAGWLNGSLGGSGNSTIGGQGGASGAITDKNYYAYNGALKGSATKGGNGGNLGLPGVSTGIYTNFAGVPTQYPPLGGNAGNYINGSSFVTYLAQGRLLGNIG